MKTTILFKYILLFTATALLTSCIDCRKNYTSTIRTIMTPMKNHLRDFYVREQTYPSNAQIDTLLEASGCKILDATQKICKYKGKTFSYDSAEGMRYPDTTQENATTQNNNQETNSHITNVTPHEPSRVEGQKVYTFAMVKEDSSCTVDMTSKGEMLNIECMQQSCLKIDP